MAPGSIGALHDVARRVAPVADALVRAAEVAAGVAPEGTARATTAAATRAVGEDEQDALAPSRRACSRPRRRAVASREGSPVCAGKSSGLAAARDEVDGSRRVCSALFFFPRGGSAHVARALCHELPAAGWQTTLVSGSLGASGPPTNAATFFSGIDVRPVEYAPAATCSDPLVASIA